MAISFLTLSNITEKYWFFNSFEPNYEFDLSVYPHSISQKYFSIIMGLIYVNAVYYEMFRIEYGVCSINRSITGTLKGIPLQNDQWVKLQRILMEFCYFKCIKMYLNH